MAIPLSFSFLSLLVVLAVLLSPLLLLAAAGRKARGNTAAGARQLPTGPAKLPIIGNIHLLFTGNPLHQTLRELSKKHGPLMHLQLGCTPTVVVSSAELAEEVLKTHDLKCCSRPLLVAFAKLSYGYSDIATTPYSDRWRQLRKFSTVELFSHKMIGSSRSIREQEIERVMEVIRARSIVDLRELLMSFSCNATCRSAFGRGYDEAGSGKLHELVEEAQAVISTVFVADYFPAMGWVDVLSGARRRLHRVHLKLDRAYQGIIDEHLDRSGGQNGEREDIVDALLRLKETEEITDDQIKGVFMNILIGGTDTSAIVVEWAMSELMRQPKIMKIAQDEVRGYVGRKGKVEESDLHQLLYLKCIVKETLRLHPPAPLIPRETMQYVELKGHIIPPKSSMYINAWAIGRDPNSWENPDIFDPKRFMHSYIEDFKGHDHLKLIPFGEGRRICPGKNLGLVTVEIILANFLYSFDWHLPSGMKTEEINMEEAAGLAIHRKYPLLLKATKYISGLIIKTYNR